MMPVGGRGWARDREPNVVDLVIAGVSVVVAVVWPLAAGSAASQILPVVVLCAVVGLGVGLLPRMWTTIGFVVGAVTAVVVSAVGGFGPYLWVATSLGFLGGCAGGGYLARRRRSVRSPTGSTPAAGSVTDRGRTGLELTRDDGAEQQTLSGPATDVVVDAVAALDGRNRTVVSLTRGTSRLDVAGDAGAALMVYHCDDQTDRRARWYHLTSPGGSGEQVEVTVAGVLGHFAERQTCRSDAARRATRYYLETGGRDPQLSWHGGREVAEMQPGTPG